MVSIKIYVEGGGDNNALRTACRRGFATFFERAGLAGRMPRIVACGGRHDAFESFRTALRRASPDELPLLLVDSETVVMPGCSPWLHLSARDGWEKPPSADDRHVYLMVQCMETWFMADMEAVAKYFGQGFNRAALRRHSILEAMEKEDVMSALLSASRDSRPKGAYRKGRDSFEVLSLLDPALVSQECSHASRLLAFLRSCR